MDEPLLRFRAKLVGLEPEGEFALLLVDLRGYRPVHASISTICARLRETLTAPMPSTRRRWCCCPVARQTESSGRRRPRCWRNTG